MIVLLLILHPQSLLRHRIECLELDESLTLVEFSLLLEVRFEGDSIIDISLTLVECLLLLEVRFEGINIIRGHIVKTCVVLLLAVMNECLIKDLLNLCCGSFILIVCALLELACPCFLDENKSKSLLERGDSSPKAFPDED